MAAAETYSNAMMRVRKLLALYRREIYHIYVIATFNGLLDLSLPLGIQAILNFIIGGAVSTSWVILIVIVTAGVVLSGVLQVMQMSISEKMQQSIFAKAAFDFAYRLPRIRYAVGQQVHLQELANRFFDTIGVQKSLSKILFDFSRSTLQIVFGLLLLSFYHPYFIWFGILLSSVLLLLLYLSMPYGLKTSFEESKYKYKVVHWLEELARTMGTFKLKGETALPLAKTDGLTNSYLHARQRHFRILRFQYFSMIGFKSLITAVLLVIGSLLFMQQEINLGQFVAAEIIILTVINAAEKLIVSMEYVYDLVTSTEKLGGISDLPLDDDVRLPTHTDFLQKAATQGLHIRFHNVSYQHPDSDVQAVRHLSFDIPAGQKVCIAGFNSAGKTTLLRLLAGLYDAYEGSILLNDLPLQNIHLPSLRRYIGSTLSQETIFSGTILENIVVGCDYLTLHDVQAAVAKVDLTEWIATQADGYNTLLSPQGKQLSKSIIRKIITARLLVAQPRLLLIEQLTDGMSATERGHLFQLLFNELPNQTVVVVSNDYDVASQCHQIIVLVDGNLATMGSFEQVHQHESTKGLFEVNI